MKFVVVGGSGYIGYHVAKELINIPHSNVVAVDIAGPDTEWGPSQIPLQKVDILDRDGLIKAFHGADCVVHCAAFGMSGMSQLAKEKIEQINLFGTKNVIEACATARVKALVYTSSIAVVFGGDEIENGTEELPYYPLHRQKDYYSLMKSVCEQLVLTADGKHGLRTCALRLSGTVGPAEKNILPRFLRSFRRFPVRFGSPHVKCQFLSVHNAAQAHVKTALGLIERPAEVGGQAFFISDGPPINLYEFCRPLVEELCGYNMATFSLPLWLLTVLSVLPTSIPFIPFVSRGEINHLRATHTFSNAKAERLLGYRPTRPYDMSEIMDYFKNRSRSKRKTAAQRAQILHTNSNYHYPSAISSLKVTLWHAVSMVATVFKKNEKRT